MEALQQFIDEFDEHAQDLTNALRKVKVLTNDLHSPELDEWMDGELYGYSDPNKVPAYRRFPGNNYGEYAGPGNSAGPNDGKPTVLFIPTENLPEGVKEFAANLVVLDAVRTLQAHNEGHVEKPWPTEYVMSAQNATALQDGNLFLTRAYQYIEASVYPGIVEQVKNRLFDFLLGIQNKSPASEGSHQPEAVGRLVNLHIYGGRNVVATGEQVHQQVSIVQKNDSDSLLAYLREHGVGEDDLQELKKAVSSEPELRPGDDYGPGVEKWFSNMMSKASTSLWEVGVKTAAEVLPKALNSFYGI